MTSIFRCVKLIKIPLKLALKHNFSQVIESSSIEKCMKKSISSGVHEFIKPLFQNKCRSFSNHLTFPLKSFTIYQSKIYFSSKMPPKKHKFNRQVEVREKSKRDEVSGENCVTPKCEKSKKRIRQDGDLKFIVNLNNMVNEMVRNHACRKMEQMNKLHNFIFKPTNCTSCMQRKKDINNEEIDQQKRSYSMSTIHRAVFPNKSIKKREQKQFKLPLKTETLYLPFVFEKVAEKKSNTIYVKVSQEVVTKGGIVPLYLLVKSSSRKGNKNNTAPTITKGFQYRVGSNHAFIPLKRKNNAFESFTPETKRNLISSTKSNDSFFTSKYPLPIEKDSATITKPKSGTMFKLKESFLKLSEGKTREIRPRRDLECNATLAEVVRKVLTALLQKEELKYSEVKKAIERLEKKVESYLEKQNTIPDDNISRSLSNLYSILVKQVQPDSKTDEIKDPLINMNVEIKDPHLSNTELEEPIDKSNLSLPCLIQDEIKEPSNNITMLANDCSDKNNKSKNSSNKVNSGKQTEFCEERKKSAVDICSDEKQNKEKDVFQKLPKAKFDDFGFNQKASMSCQRTRSNENVSSVKKDSACLNIAPDDVDIYKKNDMSDKRNIGFPNQSGPFEVAPPSPTKQSDACAEKQQKAQECFEQLDVKKRHSLDTIGENKPMGPGEITCQQKPRNLGEEVALCEKSSVNYSQPKCEVDQPVERQGIHLKDKQTCEIPGKYKFEVEDVKKPKPSYVPTPVQRPCNAHSHEPSQPPNCCKPRIPAKSANDANLKSQATIMERCSSQQSPCIPQKKPEERAEKKGEKFTPCPQSTSSSPLPTPPVKEGFIKYSNVQVESERLAKTLCKHKSSKEMEKSIEVGKGQVSTPVPDFQQSITKPREPQQAQKKSWKPFKLPKPKKKKICAPATNNCPPKQVASDSQVPTNKPPTLAGKGFIDNCKGLLRGVCDVFRSGKDKSKKKADSVNRCQSMPSMTQGRKDGPGVLPRSSDNSGSKKCMHTLFASNTKIRKKYPWIQNKELPSHLRSYLSTAFPTVTVRKPKRKTLTFKLVNYKPFGGFTFYNSGNRRNSRNYSSSKVAHIQKRKFCEACTKNLCKGIKMKSKNDRKNRYPWKKMKSELENVACTNECYLTKKSFERPNSIADGREDIAKQKVECPDGKSRKEETHEGTLGAETDPCKNFYNTSAQKSDEALGCCVEKRDSVPEENKNKGHAGNTSLTEIRRNVSKGFSAKKSGSETVIKYKEGSYDNRLITSPSKFSLIDNFKRSKSSSETGSDFEGLACVIELPLTKDALIQRTEIRIRCSQEPELNVHKQGGKRNRQILDKPHEIAILKKELDKIKSLPDDEILFCKAVKTGQSEILICKTKEQWECTKIDEEEINKIARVLRGIMIKDECNRDILVCQEITVNDCYESKDELESQMTEKLRKACLPQKQTKLEVYVSNRLLCREKSNNASDNKEIECRILQVKELVGSPLEISPTQQPVSQEISSETTPEECGQSTPKN